MVVSGAGLRDGSGESSGAVPARSGEGSSESSRDGSDEEKTQMKSQVQARRRPVGIHYPVNKVGVRQRLRSEDITQIIV